MDYPFDPIQQRTLQAAIDRIIPADDFPGASDAGVSDYIAWQLAGDLRRSAQSFLEGLASLNTQAATQFGRPFADLPADQQDLALHAIESSEFFTLLLNLAVEGYYSDPGNHGNRNEISWKMIGYQPRRFTTGQTRSHP